MPATPIPSNTVILNLFRTGNEARLLELVEDNNRLEREDYHTIAAEMGPVRGYSGGYPGRGRR